MQWFQHDSSATQDAKIKKLLIRHGPVGYAVYFHCLELIASDICETNLTFELEHDSEIIADNLKVKGTNDKSGREIVEDIMRTLIELNLFTESSGHVFCFKLLKRINLSQTSNPHFRELITEAKSNHHDAIMTRHAIIMNTNQPTNNTNQPTRTSQAPHSDSTESSPSPDKPSLPIEAYDLADLLQRLHHEHVDAKAKFSDAQVDAWARDIDKLHRIDGRDWQDIEAVITYAKTMEPTSSGFSWAPNVISGAKLRKQFTTIYGQMQIAAKPHESSGIDFDDEFFRKDRERREKIIAAKIKDGYSEEEARRTTR